MGRGVTGKARRSRARRKGDELAVLLTRPRDCIQIDSSAPKADFIASRDSGIYVNASRTLRASASGVNGFCKNGVS
jgi:hypothetical protein